MKYMRLGLYMLNLVKPPLYHKIDAYVRLRRGQKYRKGRGTK